MVEHIKSSMIELGLKFLFRVAYFTDGKKHPPQACREGGAKGVLVPPSPQQASEVHFLIDQWLKMKWNRVLKYDVKNEISEIMGFVRIFWKNNVQEAYSPKMSISGQIVSEIIFGG